jgi:hypothetical protein
MNVFRELRVAFSRAPRRKALHEVMELIGDGGGEDYLTFEKPEGMCTVSNGVLEIIADYARSYTPDQRVILRLFLHSLIGRWTDPYAITKKLKSNPLKQIVFYTQTVPVFEAMYPGTWQSVANEMLEFSKDYENKTHIEHLSTARTYPYAYAILSAIDLDRVLIVPEDDWAWLNENAMALLPVLPELLRRGTADRETAQILLTSNHTPALMEGAL